MSELSMWHQINTRRFQTLMCGALILRQQVFWTT
jgi:hypothetical protein